MPLPDNTEPSAEALVTARLIAASDTQDVESIALALDRFRAAGVREWQPIETAPEDPNLDGILIWCPSEITSSGGWAFKVRWGYHDREGVYGWLCADCDDPDLAGYATHWMPLPEPPND